MLRRLLLAVLVLGGLLLLTFALPVRVWRTGELPAPPLPLVTGGPAVELPPRIWIDTDAACGHGRTTDPDDCFAILLLARSRSVRIVGISTVHGNAPLPVTDSVVRGLVAALPWDPRPPPVHRGSGHPLEEGERAPAAPAHAAIRQALAEGPLAVLALGPLTNVAAALEGAPGPDRNVARLVAVMGRRPGHLFHPAEGSGGGMLFGHGPVFTDFNFAQDREAAARVLALSLPVTFVPYEAAREVTLLPAVHEMFDCARAEAWIGKDERLWRWLPLPDALLVGRRPGPEDRPRASGQVIYCPELRAGLDPWLVGALTSDATRPGGRAGRVPPW